MARTTTTICTESMEVAYDIVHACSEAKARDISVLDVSKLFDVTNLFIVVSGRSDRQVQGIANRVIEALDARGVEPSSVEGLEKGHWVVIDAGDVIVHVFYEPLRAHYDLEGLWMRADRLQLKKSGSRVRSVRENHKESLKVA